MRQVEDVQVVASGGGGQGRRKFQRQQKNIVVFSDVTLPPMDKKKQSNCTPYSSFSKVHKHYDTSLKLV